MTHDVRDDDELKAARRAFLLQCGRFAVVTPPVVSLMLTVGARASAKNLATSPGRIKESTTTATTTTLTRTTTTTPTTTATTTTTSTATTQTTTTTPTTTTQTATPSSSA